MPRIQSYVSTKMYNKMTDIVDKAVADGADKNDITLSSLSAKLIDMGMIMYELQNKNESDSQNSPASELSDIPIDQGLLCSTLKSILSHAFKSELYARGVFQIAMNPELVKSMGDYETIKSNIEESADSYCNKIGV